jgi:hypothetical protein
MTLQQKFIDLILKELKAYESAEINITDKVKYSQFKTVKRILTHQNNGFENASNKKRFFYNIGNSRRDTGVKKCDIDTKDISLVSDNINAQAENFLLRSELKQYLKETNHGQKLNEIVEEYVDWGNVVAKKDQYDIYKKVNLSNLYVLDVTAESLEDTTTIEKHRMYPDELKAMVDTWNNVPETIAELNCAGENKSPYYEIYERYGFMTIAGYKELKGETYTIEDGKKFIMTLMIVAAKRGNDAYYYSESQANNGYILFLEELQGKKQPNGKLKYKPYNEVHFGPYEGRWLRKGYREVLFDYQDRANILANQIYQAMKWSSIHVFWSADGKIAGKNIFKSIEQGQIIQTDNLNILPVEERNLSAHVEEWNKLMDLADKECQTFEVATGEGLPSGTTLGQVQIQTATVGEFFNFKREKLGLFIKQIFNEWVLPEILTRINAEHVLKITGDPEYMETYFTSLANAWLINNYIQIIEANGHITPEQKQLLIDMKKEEIKQSPEQLLKIEKEFYKNAKPKVDVDITGESINKQAKVTNGLALTQYLSNPVVMQDPLSRGIILEIADDLGFNVSNKGTAIPTQPMQPQTAPAPEQEQGGTSSEQIAAQNTNI